MPQVLQHFTNDLVAIRTKVTLIISDLDLELLEGGDEDSIAMNFVKVVQ